MNHKKDKWILYIILPLVILLCAGIWQLKYSVDPVEVHSQNGVWDLTHIDFGATNAIIYGDVEYVPGTLLTPEEFAQSDAIVTGNTKYVEGYLTSRVRLIVQPGGQYAFTGNTAAYASRFFVNGELLADFGMPGASAETSTPGEAMISFTAQPVNGVIEIVEQSSNYVYKDGENHDQWQIGRFELINRYVTGRVNTSYILIGCYLLLFLVHFVLFLLQRGYRANLWFSLLCFVWMLRTDVTGAKVFLILFPGLSWSAAFRIEYMTAPAALVLLLLAYNALFPGVLQKCFRIVVYSFAAVISAIFLFTGTVFMSQIILYVFIAAILFTAFAIARLCIKVRKPSVEQTLIIIGLGVVLAALVLDRIYYSHWGTILPFLHSAVLEIAIVAFSLLQMTAMIFGTMRQAAEAREAEQRLAIENAALDRVNTLKSELMANLTHEMRTPLSVMSVYAQFAVKALRKENFNAQTTADLETIQQEASRLSEMASGFLDVFKAETNAKEFAPLSIGGLLTQIGQLCVPMLKKKGNRLMLNIPEGLPEVSGNANELTQVVLNLLSNANNHTEDGEIHIQLAMDNGQLTVGISDTGEGIVPELLPRVFERRTGDGQGAGLGLAICRETIRAHGGEIGIESEPGRGTTVRFTLPAEDPLATIEGGESNG